MDLFGFSNINPNTNLLPIDGEVKYYGKCLKQTDADAYLHALLKNIEWRNDESIIMGKKIITARKVAWYGLKPFAYTYSKTTKHALPFTEELMQLKNLVEEQTGEQFNSCLLNLYHNGNEGMAWHSDAEKELKKNGAIASISLGAERKFSFKHKVTKQTVSVMLEHGSILVMKGTTQTHWLHRLPPTTRVHTPRVNLTFRFVI
jgi:alkylated DNA repair dioxygenase AlkB